jgi:hypothetical protein
MTSSSLTRFFQPPFLFFLCSPQLCDIDLMRGERHFPNHFKWCVCVGGHVCYPSRNWITYLEGTEALGNTASSTVCLISLCWLTSNAGSCSPSKLQYTLTDKCHTHSLGLQSQVFQIKTIYSQWLFHITDVSRYVNCRSDSVHEFNPYEIRVLALVQIV